MSDTPRTDAAANESIVKVYETSKELERELATVKAQLEQANIRGDYWERKCLEGGPK